MCPALATSSRICDCLSSAALSAVSLLLLLSSDFREQTMAACAAGIPFVSWAETTRDFRSRTGLFRPHQEVLGVPSLAIFPDISGHGFSASGHGKSVTSRGLLRGRWRWRGAGRRDEKMEDIGGAGLPLGITKRRDAADPPRPLRDKESNRQGTDPTQSGTPALG